MTIVSKSRVSAQEATPVDAVRALLEGMALGESQQLTRVSEKVWKLTPLSHETISAERFLASELNITGMDRKDRPEWPAIFNFAEHYAANLRSALKARDDRMVLLVHGIAGCPAAPTHCSCGGHQIVKEELEQEYQAIMAETRSKEPTK